MKYIVYVVESAEGYRYTGMTEDLPTRLLQHTSHSLSFWTKRGTNWKVVYSEEFQTKAEAAHREKWLKSGVGREFLNRTLKMR